MIDGRNAREWIERFLNGETSNIEEKELYRFFSSEDVPHSLKKYRSMFEWYANGMKDELPRPKTHLLRTACGRVGIAAVVTLAMGVGWTAYRYFDHKKYEYLEGSYIIRNGKKITDIKTILPELKRVNEFAIQQEKEMDKLIRFDADKYMEELEKEPQLKAEDLPVI